MLILFDGFDADVLPVTLIFENDDAVNDAEKTVVFGAQDIDARFDFGAALTDDDGAAGDQLAAVALGAQTLGVAFSTVLRTAKTFLMCHILFSFNPERI
jgi:hypothetical protein